MTDRLRIVPGESGKFSIATQSGRVVSVGHKHVGEAYRELQRQQKGRWVRVRGKSVFLPDKKKKDRDVIQATLPPPVFKVGFPNNSARGAMPALAPSSMRPFGSAVAGGVQGNSTNSEAMLPRKLLPKKLVGGRRRLSLREEASRK